MFKKIVLLLLVMLGTVPVLAAPNGMVMTDKKHVQGDHQVFYCRSTFPKDSVDSAFKSKYHIIAVDYVKNEWCVTMNRNLNWGYQSYNISGNIPFKYINEGQADGLTITSMASSSGQIVIVMTQNSPWKQGDFSLYTAPWMIGVGPRGDQGNLFLSAVASIPNASVTGPKWIAAYGTHSSMQAQKKEGRSSFPGLHISNQWQAGYQIDFMFWGAGKWWVVTSKRGVSTRQSYIKYSRESINQKWAEGYYISDIY